MATYTLTSKPEQQVSTAYPVYTGEQPTSKSTLPQSTTQKEEEEKKVWAGIEAPQSIAPQKPPTQPLGYSDAKVYTGTPQQSISTLPKTTIVKSSVTPTKKTIVPTKSTPIYKVVPKQSVATITTAKPTTSNVYSVTPQKQSIDTNKQKIVQIQSKYYAEDRLRGQSRRITIAEAKAFAKEQQGTSSIEEEEKRFYSPVTYKEVGTNKIVAQAEWKDVVVEKPKEVRSDYTGGTGVITASSNKKISWIKKQQYKYMKKSSSEQSTFSAIPLAVGYGAYKFVGGVVKGFTLPIRMVVKPKETFKEIKGTAKFVGGLFTGKTQQALQQQGVAQNIRNNPIGTSGFVGETIGFGVGAGAFAKVYKSSGGPIVVTEKVGSKRTIGIDYGLRGKGKTLVSFKTKGEFTQSPKTGAGTDLLIKDIDRLITSGSEMLVEGKTIPKSLVKDFTVKGIKSSRELALTKSKFVEPEVLKTQGTRYLEPKEANIIYSEVTKSKGDVFGSSITQPQLKPELRRDIGDIEGMFKTSNEVVLKEFTENVYTKLKSSSKSEFRIDPESPFHIEKKVKGVWEKVAEFKGKGIGEGDVAPDKAYGYNLWTSKDFGKVGDTRGALLRGELKRKLTASTIPQKASTSEVIYPEAIPEGQLSAWSGKPIPTNAKISKVFHHTDYVKNEGVWLTPKEHSLIHKGLEGKAKVSKDVLETFKVKEPLKQETTVGVAHTGRFKDVPDYFRITKTLSESKASPTPKTVEFLKLEKELGIITEAGPIKLQIGKPKSSIPSVGISKTSYLIGVNKPISSIKASSSPQGVVSITPSPSYNPKKIYSPEASISPSVSVSPSPRSSPYRPSPSPSSSKSPSVIKSISVKPSVSPSPGSPSPYRPSPSPSPSTYRPSPGSPSPGSPSPGSPSPGSPSPGSPSPGSPSPGSPSPGSPSPYRSSPPYSPPPMTYSRGRTPKQTAGFNIFVRKSGKLVKANVNPLSEEDAIKFAQFKVGSTARASYKILPAFSPAKEKFAGGVTYRQDFYKSKSGFYVEKRERRIKSLGELQEITYKGIRTKRAKGMFTRLKNYNKKLLGGK